MAVDLNSPRPRRAILAASMGALAATVAQAFGRPERAAAADGQTVLVGGEYTSSSVTKIAAAGSAIGIRGESSSAAGVHGQSNTGAGMRAASNTSYGLLGTTGSTSVAAVAGLGTGNRAGVHGVSGGAIAGAPEKVGVYGTANQDDTAAGVKGQSTDGRGVVGDSTFGTGVAGNSEHGTGVVGGTFTGIGVDGYTHAGNGVRGRADLGVGVLGETALASLPGVRGVGKAADGIGVQGWVGAASPPAPQAKTGVHGRCDLDSSSFGVFGQSATGTGTRGNTSSGTGVLGVASGAAGFGIRSIGRVGLQNASGVATIASGASSVVVTPGTDIVASTFVIVTPQADPGTRRLWATTDPAADTLTIHVSAAVSGSLKVAWLALG
jgi:hypothetical protein